MGNGRVRNSLCGKLNEQKVVMDKNLSSLDLNTLKGMYEKESGELKAALLRGAGWDDLREQRHRVTDLAIAIHKKRMMPGNNPAEASTRSDRNKK